MNRNLKRAALLLALWAMIVLAVLPVPAWAQEGGESTAAQTPAGIGVLIFIMGLGALVVVGVYYVMQGRAGRKEKSQPREQ